MNNFDSLAQMFGEQRQLQIKSYGKDPSALEGEERIQFIKDMKLALDDELAEFLAEVGWKPWASSRHVNVEPAQGELVDVFHFFMNLCMVVGLTPEALHEKYMLKRQKNADRQRDGYDGVTTKCAKCKRALDDEGVTCKRPYPHGPYSSAWCGQITDSGIEYGFFS